jgi:hypothetical protein
MRPALFKTRNFYLLPVNQLTGQNNHHDAETNIHEITAITHADLETLLI